MPRAFGGLEACALFIDTEGKLSTEVRGRHSSSDSYTSVCHGFEVSGLPRCLLLRPCRRSGGCDLGGRVSGVMVGQLKAACM
jgi:hypothetical protein